MSELQSENPPEDVGGLVPEPEPEPEVDYVGTLNLKADQHVRGTGERPAFLLNKKDWQKAKDQLVNRRPPFISVIEHPELGNGFGPPDGLWFAYVEFGQPEGVIEVARIGEGAPRNFDADL